MSAAAVVHPELAQAGFEDAIQPLLDNPERYGKFGVRFVDFAFPYLDVDLDWRAQGRVIRLRVDGTDYPYRPVEGWWIDGAGQRLLAGTRQVPSGNGFHTQDQRQQQKCWLCFLGWRSYHDYSTHQQISWASIRRDPRYSVLQQLIQLVTELNKTGVALT